MKERAAPPHLGQRGLIKGRVGDDLFFDTLQTYYGRHRYQIAMPESFLDTAEEVTGDRPTELYQNWISVNVESS